jgi:histidinol dehydrogenase
MLLTPLDLRGRRPPFDEDLPRPVDAGEDVAGVVSGIIARVRAEGDAAVGALTAEFDGAVVEELRVSAQEVAGAAERVPPALHDALELAYRRIYDYHANEGTPPGDFSSGGVTVRHLLRPVERAGCYAPGGRARYPSTVLMCAAPARVARVPDVVLCVPPGPSGHIDDATLAAASIAGIDEIYAVGGAQAIAAMAYGTETIARVDVIVGPGNLYVAEAKRQVSGVVGVASAFAGPSEVVVVAGPETPAVLAAIDLVVQAEHGPDGLAWLVTWSPDKAAEVSAEVERLVAASPRRADLEATFGRGGYACLVDGVDDAMAVANVVAPEHLELMVDDAEALLPLVRAAGAVFCGPGSPASLGDYVAGPNHVLPTNRSARFASALRADDFRRHIHAVTAGPGALDALGPAVMTLAETEGLAAHAESIRLRS